MPNLPRFTFGLASFLFIQIASASGFADCADKFYNKAPPKVQNPEPRDRELCFSEFALLHSGSKLTPVFVVERLSAKSLGNPTEQRTDKFYAESRLPSSERANLADYKQTVSGLHLDRGHMAPAADMRTPEGMAQSFSLANMVPQAPQLNRGVWAKSVERAVRDYVSRAAGDVFVYTGPVYTGQPRYVGSVRVPDYIYKLMVDATTKKTVVFWVPNVNTVTRPDIIPYETLVERTGIRFF